MKISDWVPSRQWKKRLGTDARTLENSEVGDMTKLSLELDHEMRCWMLGSSSIL